MIYLLEDDDNIRKLVTFALKSQGLDCQDFATPKEFWATFQKEKPDLTLLDIMLPQEDGISILKKIKNDPATSSIPVIMITARDTEFDMVNGLDAGADDYITKPFGMMALVARVKAVLRRYENTAPAKADSRGDPSESALKLGSISLDQNSHTVYIEKKQIFLTVKEFDLLALLIKNKENVLTREYLLNSIWNVEADVESRTIDVHVRTLRQKLGEWGDCIETIRGVGYKISKKRKNKGKH